MFWKKPVNISFVLVLAVVVMLFSFSLICLIHGGDIANGIIDPEGLSSLLGSRLADIYPKFLLYSALFMVMFWSFLILALLLIARRVYMNEGNRLLAYRIIMGILHFLLGIVLMYLSVLSTFFPSLKSLVFPIYVVILVVIVVNVLITYSNKITIS